MTKGGLSEQTDMLNRRVVEPGGTGIEGRSWRPPDKKLSFGGRDREADKGTKKRKACKARVAAGLTARDIVDVRCDYGARGLIVALRS